MKKHFGYLLVVLLTIAAPTQAAIEAVVIPPASSGSFEVLRWSLFRDGNQVKYGQCDSLEFECTPDTPSLTLLRTLPYSVYLKQLAERFRVSESYVVNHGNATASYDAHMALLAQVHGNAQLGEGTCNKAKCSLDYMTQREGIIDRFAQAVALKRALEWPRSEAELDALAKAYPALWSLNKKIQSNQNLAATPEQFQGLLSYIADLSDAGSTTKDRARRVLRLVQAETRPAVRETVQRLTSRLLADSSDAETAAREIDGLIGVVPGAREALADSSFTQFYQDDLRPRLDAFRAHALGSKRDDIVPPPDTPVAKPHITFEKSVVQFEQSLWAMNFAEPLHTGPESLTRTDEPSTGKTYVLAAAAVTFGEAGSACSKLGSGFRLATWSDFHYSNPWLHKSNWAEKIPSSSLGKRVWMSGQVQASPRFIREEERAVEIRFRTTQIMKVKVNHWDYDFPAVVLGSTLTENASRVKSNEEKQLSASEALDQYGFSTEKLPAVCVGPTKFVPPKPEVAPLPQPPVP